MPEKQYDPKEIEEQVRDLWDKIKLADKIAALRKGNKKFYLLDGPPYVNAVPHVGHIKTTTCKDVWSKFKLMQGSDSWLQPGFDCHGLPVEVMVEKELGIETKSDIERTGVEKFIELCLKKVLFNEKVWMDVYKLLGGWRGFYEPYFTYKNYYIESGWWTIKQLHENGFLTEGLKPIHWCPHCETALSGYEVSDSYANVTDIGIYVKFETKPNEFILVYTTTPWTLPGNVALAVHPKENYVKIKVKTAGSGKATSISEEHLILAEKRLKPLADMIGFEYEVIERMKGEELDGLEYKPILDVERTLEKTRKVYLSIPIMKYKKYKKHKAGKEEKEEFEEFVTMEEGSGVVHCAPGHGSSDYLFGKYYNLPAVSPVNESGKFTAEAGEWKGMFVKDADKKIIEKLESEGKLFYSSKITHSYPLCWRCKTPLIFRLSKQWYLKVEPIKEKMIKANEKVKWMPPFGKERFEDWLVEREDWCISQQRYWGIPIPIWICSSCGRKEVISSADELKKKSGVKELPDLHRNVIDKIKIKCDCGGTQERIKDIFNVWYDSGIAPWASLGYPFQNKELFEKMFPCDLIVEGQDQIRGWFDSLMFTSMAVFGKSPYRAVGMMGWVVDEKGEKMSKSLGNVVWADDGLKKLGADIIRLYYCWEVAPWEIQKFSFRTCEEVRRDLNILWNTYNFVKEYCRKEKDLNILCVEDKWILSRVNSLNREVVERLENFEFHIAGRKIMDFVTNDLSRFYIKLVRDRVAPSRKEKTVHTVLFYVMERIAKMLAPLTPFISEHIYQDLFKENESIHLCDWPSVEENFIDKNLEEQMQTVKEIIETANAIRQEKDLKLKYALPSMSVSGGEEVLATVKKLSGILAKMANVKAVRTGKENIEYGMKLNYAIVGKKFGKNVKKLEEALKKIDPEKSKAQIEKSGKFKLNEFMLSKNDLIFTQKPLKEGRAFSKGIVVLDTKVSKELKQEWLLRELIRAVQEERKKTGLKITDKIRLHLPAEFKSFEKYISNETGSKVSFGKIAGKKSSFEFEENKYEFGVEK